MKIRIKPLKEAEFFIEDVSETVTIGELKQRIEKEKSDYSADCLRLILLGKVLKDDKTLKDLGFDESKNYLVLVATKAKKKPEVKPTPAPVPQARPAATTTTTQSTAPVTQAPPTPQVNNETMVTQEKIDMVKAMGFAETDARAALAAAFGNVEVAIEYITNPEAMEQAIQRNAMPAPRVPVPTTAANANLDPLQRFKASPQFEATRRALEQDPSQIQTLVTSLRATNPDLFTYVTQNPANMEKFVEMLSGDDDENTAGGNVNPFGEAPPGLGAGLGGLGEGAEGMMNPQALAAIFQMFQSMPEAQRRQVLERYGLPPDSLDGLDEVLGAMGGGEGGPMLPPQRIELTEADRTAIDNMVSMGFPRNACIEAYLACDKNADMAINLLLTNPPEADMMDQDEGNPPPPNNANNGGGGNDMGDI